MWQASPNLRRALEDGAPMTTVVDVLRGTTLVASDLDVNSIACSATLTTTEGRACTLRVDREITDAGLLDPLTDVVLVRSGVPGVELVPLFVGRVDAHADSSSGEVSVACMSRYTEAVRDSLETPFAVLANTAVTTEIRRIIQEVDASWGVDTSRVSNDILVPAGLVWEDSRATALSDLCVAAGSLLLPDRTGGFVLLPSLFVGEVIPLPQMTLTDGENGVLMAVDQVRTRTDLLNSVTVIVERTDGTAPIRATARDLDPGSPTFWGGLFGKQSRVIKIDTPATATEAAAYAQRVLRASLSLARSWRISIPHDPRPDPGDVIAVLRRGEPTLQLVESVDYSGAADQPTVIATRQLILHEADIGIFE
jgi:hypothetical protein